jgi:16S rRNA (adenine1518-N6/adenine1519-N6)-dimethyltransferase
MNNIRAKKSLGQNFLHNHHTLEKIIRAADLSAEEDVIEVGPGQGALTTHLLENAQHVTAIEIDDRLIPELEEKFSKHKNFTLKHQDALTFTPPETPYKLVANIPYYITSPLINHFLREQPESHRPQQLTLLVQKEVAQKVCARPEEDGLNVLALQVQLFGTPKIIAKVPPSHFHPAPKVDSAILNIERTPCPLSDDLIPTFFKIVHAGFAHRRKKLSKNLENNLGINRETVQAIFEQQSLDPSVRAERLTLNQWVQLTQELQAYI